jgi:hypothetical protein
MTEINYTFIRELATMLSTCVSPGTMIHSCRVKFPAVSITSELRPPFRPWREIKPVSLNQALCSSREQFTLHKTHNHVILQSASMTVSIELWTERFRSKSIHVYLHTLHLRSTILWDVMPWSAVHVHWRFGEKYRFHIRGRRVSQKQVAGCPWRRVICWSYGPKKGRAFR